MNIFSIQTYNFLYNLFCLQKNSFDARYCI